MASCAWSDQSYALLRSVIEQQVPEGQRDEALKRIEPLGKPPSAEDEVSAKAWRELEKSSPSPQVYRKGLVDRLKKIGCATEGAPYVISGLITQLAYRFRDPSRLAAVAKAFLDEPNCPGALGLSEENKAKLREIRDRVPAKSGSGAGPQ